MRNELPFVFIALGGGGGGGMGGTSELSLRIGDLTPPFERICERTLALVVLFSLVSWESIIVSRSAIDGPSVAKKDV